VADRAQLLTAIQAGLERANPENDFVPVLEPAALAESRLLGDMLHEGDGDFESRYLLGWLHLYRYYALPAGQDKQDYDAAVGLSTQCFVAGVDGLPESLRPALARRAVAAADSLLGEAMNSPDRELAITAVGLWRRIVDATPADGPAWARRLSRLGVAFLVGYGRTGVLADLDAAVQAQQRAVPRPRLESWFSRVLSIGISR
jgi:hypothetical protein